MPKVLVIDDSLSVRKVVERALAGRQIDVVSVASGGEALERIERESPDIVVCDVVMPDRDGYEICTFVKNHPRLSATPVLLMSGIVNDEVRARAEAARSAGVLAKPFAADDLLRHLDALLANGRAPAPTRAEPPAPRLQTPVRLAASPPPVTITPSPRGTPGVPPPVAATPSPRGTDGVRTVLEGLAKIEGVQWAVVTDREGFVIEATSQAGVEADVAAALSACLAESSDGLGRELGRGVLAGMILEYDKGVVVLYGVGASALLAIGLTDAAALGKVRYYAKKAVADLARIV